MRLRYGTNPHQEFAAAEEGADLVGNAACDCQAGMIHVHDDMVFCAVEARFRDGDRTVVGLAEFTRDAADTHGHRAGDDPDFAASRHILRPLVRCAVNRTLGQGVAEQVLAPVLCMQDIRSA